MTEEQRMEEMEIDLKDLIFYLLYHWRSILIGMLAACVLLGALGARKAYSVSAQETRAEAMENYLEEKQIYEDNLAAYEDKIENYRLQWQAQKDYTEQSLKMQLNPYDKVEARATFFLKTDVTDTQTILSFDPTDAFVKAYAVALLDDTNWEQVGQEAGIQTENGSYVRELVGVSSDYSANTFTVGVSYSDEETAKAILGCLIRQAKELQRQITGSMGEHSLTLIYQGTVRVVDTGLADQQKSAVDKSETFRKNITDTKTALDKLEEPSEPSFSGMKKVLKYALVGAFLGAFFVAGCWCVLYILNMRLHTPDELVACFRWRILSVFETERKKRLFHQIDDLLRQLQGSGDEMEKQAALDWAGRRIAIQLKDQSNILITGSVKTEQLREIRDDLQPGLGGVVCSYGAYVPRNAESFELAKKADAVVFVEQRGFSRMQELQKEQEIMEQLGKPVLGCIVL